MHRRGQDRWLSAWRGVMVQTRSILAGRIKAFACSGCDIRRSARSERLFAVRGTVRALWKQLLQGHIGRIDMTS